MLSNYIIVVFLILIPHIMHCARIRRMIGGKKVECGVQIRAASVCTAAGEHLCGSTLLSPRFAVTAAHCVQHEPAYYVLTLDNYCTDIAAPIANVLNITRHDSYDKYSGAHDLALLRIDLDVNAVDVSLLSDSILPKSLFGLRGDCLAYGYRTDSQTNSKDLMVANMTIMSLDECLTVLGEYVAPNYDGGMMCALGAGADTCQGDSGGPLMCKGLLEGIGSYGLACGVPGIPGVFTSIGAHVNWITSIMNTIYQ